MKRCVLLTLVSVAITGCATLEPVYEKWNAQVAAFKKVVSPTTASSPVPASVQEESGYFFENDLSCWVDPKSPVNVRVSEVHYESSSGKMKKIEKPGMVGLAWEGRKLVWSKAEKLQNGGYRFNFPGRKPMLIKQIRVRNKEVILRGKYMESFSEQYDPYISIEEIGGKKWICAEEIPT